MWKDLDYKIRRAETPLFRAIKRFLKIFLQPTPPRLPRVFKPLLAALYQFHFIVIVVFRYLSIVLYKHPLLQGRASMGRNVQIDGLPFIAGPVEVYLGDNTYLGGKISIMSGAATSAPPRLVMEPHSMLGWNSIITVQQEVVLEEYAIVAYDCRISDNGSHPIQADLRIEGKRVEPKDIRPVRIGKYAWIGNGTHVLKGVTIGEGAVVGPNSVVMTDLPPYSLSMGNPAEVILRNYGKPSRRTPPPNMEPSPEQAVKPGTAR